MEQNSLSFPDIIESESNARLKKKNKLKKEVKLFWYF
jgi:hypothetical protein